MRRRLYHDYLGAKFLKRAASQAGFRSPDVLENFIMDFEVHNMVSSRLDVCLRGGMAAPFYLDSGAMRLSRDVDLFVFEPEDAARAAMQDLALKQDDYGIRINKLPQHPSFPHLPLAQYNVEYRSALGQTSTIKLDLLCDPQIKAVPDRVVRRGFNLGCFSTRHSVRLLDHGALVADKITSLSEPPVGYGAERRGQMHKQMYDIALLLKGRPRADLAGLIDAYRLLASAKSSYAGHGGSAVHSPAKIMAGVFSSVLALLDRERGFALTREFSDGFSAFKGTYLGSLPYARADHQANALLVALFAARMLKRLAGAGGTNTMDEFHRRTIGMLLSLGNPSTRLAAERDVKEAIQADDPTPARYASMLPDVAYLVHRIRLEEEGS